MNILDLPTEIIRIVLDYLPDKDVYFNIRSVCHRLRDIGNDHVQLGKWWISGMYYLFNYRNQIIFIYHRQ